MTRRLRIEVAEAETSVSAHLEGDPRNAPLLVFGHGAGAGIDHPVQRALGAALVARGIALLRYQFPFMERRGGRGFGRDPLPVAVASVRAAVARAVELAGPAGVLAGGHSYGGRMTTHAALDAGLPGIRGLVILAFPLRAGRTASQRGAHLAEVSLPMLFVSGERDGMAPAPELERLVDGLPQAALVRIPGADHGWRAPKRVQPDGPFPAVAAAVADWAWRLPPAPPG